MLVIRLQTPNDPEPAWALLDSAQAGDWTHGSWETLLPFTHNQTVLLLIPSREVLLTHISLNTRNPRQLQQAIPYALEEVLVDDPETQHIVWQTRPSSDPDPNRIEVAVIARERLRTWVSALQARHLRAHMVLPDLFALPWETGTITLWQQGGQLWLRTGELTGSASTAGALPLLLDSLLANPPADTESGEATPLRIRLHSDQPDAAWLHDPRLSIEPELHPEQLFASSLQPALKLNLLQGLVDENSSHLHQQWQRWRLAAGLAAFSAALALGLYALGNYRLQQQLNALDTANLSLFAEVFPHSQVPDPRELKGRLASELQGLKKKGAKASDTASPLALLSGLANSLAGAQGVQIEDIHTQADTLTVALQSKDLPPIENLKKTLETALGKPVALKSSRTDDAVKASLTLGGST